MLVSITELKDSAEILGEAIVKSMCNDVVPIPSCILAWQEVGYGFDPRD